MGPMFIHLRLHTEFSVVDSTNRVDDVVDAAAADGQGALAITDLNNLFATVKFYRACRSKGVKPVVGAEVIVEGMGADPLATSRMVLLVQNKQGYLNLSELLARAHTQNTGKPQVAAKLAWLKELNEGLICLSGAQAGPVGQALVQGDAQRAHDVALEHSEQDHQRDDRHRGGRHHQRPLRVVLRLQSGGRHGQHPPLSAAGDH